MSRTFISLIMILLVTLFNVGKSNCPEMCKLFHPNDGNCVDRCANLGSGTGSTDPSKTGDCASDDTDCTLNYMRNLVAQEQR